MKSPITNSFNTTLTEEIDSKTIIDKYNRELSIDTTRFFEENSTVQIYQCNDTGYRFYLPYSSAGDEDFYAALQANYATYYRKSKWEYNQAKSLLRKDMNVLEIGCGRGAFLSQISEMVASCVGLELNCKAIEIAISEGLDVRNELIDIHADKYPEKYDVVCFFQVLEHITDVRVFLESAIKSLRKGGLLIIGVPNSEPYLYKYDKLHTLNLPPHHAGLWNKTTFLNLVKYFPIEVRSIKYEPLYAMDLQIKVRLKHRNRRFLLSIARAIPNAFYYVLGKIFGRFFKGATILVCYTKK